MTDGRSNERLHSDTKRTTLKPINGIPQVEHRLDLPPLANGLAMLRAAEEATTNVVQLTIPGVNGSAPYRPLVCVDPRELKRHSLRRRADGQGLLMQRHEKWERRDDEGFAPHPMQSMFDDFRTPATSDGKELELLRNSMKPEVTAQYAQAMRPHLEQIINSYVHPLESDGKTVIDFKKVAAEKIPAAVTCALLGVDVAKYGHQLYEIVMRVFAGTDDQAKADLGSLVYTLLLDEQLDPGSLLARYRARMALPEGDENRLTHQQAVHTVVQIVAGGFDTTVSGITAGANLLARRPDLVEYLRTASRSAWNYFIEEILRSHPPVLILPRYFNTEEVTTPNGVVIPTGSNWASGVGVSCWHPSNGVATTEYREDRTAALNLAFGWGSHGCPGSFVAKAEMEMTLSELIKNFDLLPAGDPGFVPAIMANQQESALLVLRRR